MHTLYIAEKPSLGRTIADSLGGGRSQKGAIIGKDWTVTWCIGHLYEQAMPEDYDPALKKWLRDSLPIIPQVWQLKPKSKHKAQIAIIKGHLSKTQQVVHCGDPDREGQLLVDELLQTLHWKGAIRRAWLPDLTPNALSRALHQAKNNLHYHGLSDAALGRSRADWLVGMNLSRAMTIANQKSGGNALISIGRVQTPTLKLVVDRDREIENFKPKDYFNAIATFEQKKEVYQGKWLPNEDISDASGHCLKQQQAMAVIEKVSNAKGEIINITLKAKKDVAPLPFSLNELQQAASRRFGLSAQRTLDTAQALYEKHKLISYPRTDCRYLANDQHNEVKDIFSALSHNGYGDLLSSANSQQKGRAFNDKKITAHTAIIPTANTSGGLNSDEKNVYDMVVRTYIAQFYPDYCYAVTQVMTECQQEKFISKGKQVQQSGWKDLFPSKKKTDEITLPMLQQGEVFCRSALVENKQTKPPAHYTEGTLIHAMASVAKFVKDEKLRKILRENQGIGTEATRANIIETLKNRTFLSIKGKSIQSTSLGGQLIDQIPEQLGNPAITAWWEQQLAEVEQGTVKLADFEARAINWINRLLEAVDQQSIKQPMQGKNRSKGTKQWGKGKPTAKMIRYADSLAKQNNTTPPRGYKSNFTKCKGFLDSFGANK